MIQINKQLLIIALFIIPLFTITAFTEGKASKLDLFLLTGYGIPIGGYTEEDYLRSVIYTESGSGIDKVEDHYLNYGQGIQIKAGADYFVTNNLGWQFALNYTLGVPSIKVEFDDNAPINQTTYTDKYKRSMLGVNVMLIPRFEAFNLLDIYTGIGIGLFFSFLKIENNNSEVGVCEGFFKTKPTIAFSTIVGTDFPINDKLTAFCELSFDQMSFKLKSRRNTDSNTQIDYEKDSNSSPAPIKIPGSNVGIRVGIRLIILNLEKTPEVF